MFGFSWGDIFVFSVAFEGGEEMLNILQIVRLEPPAHKGCAMLAISDWALLIIYWTGSGPTRSFVIIYLYPIFMVYSFLFSFFFVFYFLCPGVVRLASVPQFRLESTAHLP